MGRTIKDDRKKRPEWLKKHEPKPLPKAEVRGGRRSLEQLLEDEKEQIG